MLCGHEGVVSEYWFETHIYNIFKELLIQKTDMAIYFNKTKKYSKVKPQKVSFFASVCIHNWLESETFITYMYLFNWSPIIST